MTPAGGTVLTIINKYGSVVTETWDRDYIVIDVTVKVDHPSRERADRMLEMITVGFTESDGNLKAETLFSREFSSRDFSSWRWRGSSQSFSINYTISMPAWVSLDLTNRYGKTLIGDLSGHVRLKVSYGDLTAGKLTRGDAKPLNAIEIAYGNAAVDELGWAEINARYVSTFSVERARALLIDSKYSKFSLNEVSSLVADSKYDGYRVGKANNIVAMGGYTDFRFSQVNRKLEVDTRYGNLTVERIPPRFEKISVKSGYCNVRLGFDPAACYKLDARSTYCSIRFDESLFKADRRITGSSSTELSGQMGHCNRPRSAVDISASYGSVRID